MAVGRNKTPEEMKDEDLWFGLRKPQLAVAIIFAGIAFFIGSIFWGFGLYILALYFGAVILILGAFLILFPVPERWFLYGGGNQASKIIIRWILHKFVYTRYIFHRTYKDLVVEEKTEGVSDKITGILKGKGKSK